MVSEPPVVPPSRAHRLLELAGYFLWLGTTGFGGPVALCAMMERDLVERRGWLGKAEMGRRDRRRPDHGRPAGRADGHHRLLALRVLGAWTAGSALILPTSVMVETDGRAASWTGVF